MNEMKIQLYIVKDESRIKALSTKEVGVNLKITMSWNYLWSTFHIFMQHLFFPLENSSLNEKFISMSNWQHKMVDGTESWIC